MPFTSQGALHANFRTSYETWAAHWATCGEGRNADAQGALVRVWVSQASAVVQMAQNRLTRKLVEMLLTVNPGSGDMMRALRPIQLHELEGLFWACRRRRRSRGFRRPMYWPATSLMGPTSFVMRTS